MNKLNKVAVLFAAAAMGAAPAFAQDAKNTDNWVNPFGLVWKNGTNEFCWRDAGWTPAGAVENCDGWIKPVPPTPPAPPVEKVEPTPPAPPAPPVAPPLPKIEKVSLKSDTLFDFNKSVLKPEGKKALDGVVESLKGLNLEVIIAVGHTDSVGGDAYNQKLSVARAEAVKKYLVDAGVDKIRVYTEGKGKTQPVADNKTAEGRAKNRRVDIEVVGTREIKK